MLKVESKTVVLSPKQTKFATELEVYEDRN